jgi:N-acetylmuramoyl-L-alanine amidase
MKLIAIDDGHGMETTGKRTPIFSNGSFMHENAFNNAVIQLLKINLERCGFKTLVVAPGDNDIPLKTRTDAANNLKADFYQSVHANAMTGTWQDAAGIETFHNPGSVEGEKAAKIIHKYLLQGTALKDRGVKTANFHVLRETHMPSVLCECGFMDNIHDAQLLLTSAYRQECADEIAKGICEYFGMAYVPKPAESKYYKIADTHIIELDPMSLRAGLVSGCGQEIAKTVKNFINANFFSGKKTIGWLISEGKVLSERHEEKIWVGNVKGTLIVYKNGRVEVGWKRDGEIAPLIKDIWFCCQGFNLLPMDIKKEGFNPDEVGRTCKAVSIGYNGSKIIIAVRPESDAKRSQLTMKNLKCTGAIRLDSGSSVNLIIGNKVIFSGPNTLTNIAYWK